ncbi:MAG: cbb3-type cytochrome c oxidase subunit I [Candidatus Omnitrophica bacterium]|nr:cbb3-type cytochrome c oxidase subunit I [Candidatus Omnitrophota bacterium]
MSEHKRLGFVRKYIFSTDHKIIGIQFLFSSLIFMAFGGLLAMLMRWQLGWPGAALPWMEKVAPAGMPGGVMVPEYYNMLFTMHGSVMIFFGVIPILAGAFGNYLIPLKVGAPDMAFPRLNMLSYWLFPIAAATVLAGFFVEGGAAASGWTAYPPLSGLKETMGPGQTLWAAGVVVLGFSSILGAVNYVATVINHRAPGMSFHRLPISIWALFTTAVLTLLATPVLAAAMILLLLDRSLGTSFFLPAGMIVDGNLLPHAGGQAILWQHLFWFYSHPAVYIMILPAMGFVSDILPTFSRKPIFGYHAIAYSAVAIGAVGFLVWAHHMFQSGMNPTLGTTFMISTMVVAVPTGVKVFSWLGTLWRGSIRLTTPMLHALGFISMFIIGGLTGIFLASTPVDMYFHDTYFVVGHIHYVLFGGSLFGAFAGITFWFPKMFGRRMNEPWGKIHFWLTFLFFNCVMFPMFSLGLGGMPRRIYDYTQYPGLVHFAGLNRMMSMAAFCLMASQLLFAFNFLYSLFRGKKAGENPWEATTLEWETPSPPPHGNFAKTPVVLRGPYEFSVPGRERDWQLQTEED